jgi:transcriptional regulator with XRE-family HTH domain
MKTIELWRQALIDYRHKINMPYREIAEKANLSEKGVARIFTGEAKNPSVDDVRKIISAMGAPQREIFGESSAVITTEDIDKLKADNLRLTNENNALIAENLVLSNKVKELEASNTLLSIKLEYEQKITSLHDYYSKAMKED